MIPSLMSLLTAVVEGLTLGSIYALVGVTFNILYRPTNVFNFAQGELVMIGAMLGGTVMAFTGLPFLVAALIVFVGVGLLALLQERMAVEPVLRRSSTSHLWLITTLACSMILVNVVMKIWGADPVRVDPPWPLTVRSFEVSGLFRTSTYSVALIVFAVVLVWAIERVYRTRAGAAILAVAEDRDAALLRGVRPERLARLSFFLGGGLAALVGLICAPIMFASTVMGALLLFKGFAAAAIGGIGSNKGCLIAGLILGTVEALGILFLSPGYQTAVVFLVFLGVLMIRPQGFFGQAEARNV